MPASDDAQVLLAQILRIGHALVRLEHAVRKAPHAPNCRHRHAGVGVGCDCPRRELIEAYQQAKAECQEQS